MSRRRKRKPERQTWLPPEERERRQKEAEGWRKRAETERVEGVSQTDASARWIAAKEGSCRSLLLKPTSAAWRAKPTTAQQQAILRERGLNPLLYRTRGAASDAIARASGRRAS